MEHVVEHFLPPHFLFELEELVRLHEQLVEHGQARVDEVKQILEQLAVDFESNVTVLEPSSEIDDDLVLRDAVDAVGLDVV